MYKLNLQYDTYRLFKGEAGFETFKKCIAAKLIFDTERSALLGGDSCGIY